MPAEIFNPNPTIFAPSKPSKRASSLETQIWAPEADAPEPADDSDETEPIDQDEVFGTSSVFDQK
jgi:hypothetical protein